VINLSQLITVTSAESADLLLCINGFVLLVYCLLILVTVD